MKIEDTIGYRPEIPVCAVCGKNVQGGGGLARINYNGTMIDLCCPLCMETFQNDPFPYVARMVKNELLQDLKAAAKKTP